MEIFDLPVTIPHISEGGRSLKYWAESFATSLPNVRILAARDSAGTILGLLTAVSVGDTLTIVQCAGVPQAQAHLIKEIVETSPTVRRLVVAADPTLALLFARLGAHRPVSDIAIWDVPEPVPSKETL